MSFQEIINIFEKLNPRIIVLLCHHNADPDAICSAYAFEKLMKHFRPNLEVEIGAAHGISRLSKHLLTQLPIKIKKRPNIEKADIITLLDTNTIQQLDDLADRVKKSNAPIIVIDHHAAHPSTEQIAELCITDEKASSTCEIVYKFYKDAQIEPDMDAARALFLGIAFDTRHFIIANSSTLKTVAELSEAGVNARETLALLSLPMDFSERVARLKASRRIRLVKIDSWIIAFSHVSAYQASSARAIIELGAHVAVVAGEKSGKLEISLRSTREFHEKTDIHLGRDIARPLGEYLHGMGGGHSTAAGINGIGDVQIGLNRCLWIFRQKLTNN